MTATKDERIPVEVAFCTDPGRDPEKQENEDACAHRETAIGHLCVVCDGMGGHASGREASTLALETILDHVANAPAGMPPGLALEGAITEANRRVFALGASHYAQARPGSTVVALLIHRGGTEVAHVGDSRGYHVHGGQVFQITRDHSLVQELIDAKVLTPDRAAHHPEANKIMRALGMGDTVEVELRPQPIGHVAGDVFVLCSDGLSDLVEPEEILEVVGTQAAAQAAQVLVDMANARGGHDNITAVVVRTLASAAVAPGAVPATDPQRTLAMGAAPPPVTLVPPAERERAGAPSSRGGGTGAPPVSSARGGPSPLSASSRGAPAPVDSVRRIEAPLLSVRPSGAPAPVRPAEPPKQRLTLVLGLTLAAFGLLIAAAAVYVLHRERAGRHAAASPAVAPGAAPASAAPVHPPVLPLTPAPMPPPAATPEGTEDGAAPLPALVPARSARPRAH